MQIKINGQKEQVEDNLTIAGLLTAKKVESPDMVSVQINDAIIDRTRYPTTVVNENDVVEFLYFMGGGALP